MDHLLDRPIWTALTTRQTQLAREAGGVRRFAPAFAPFAASADGTSESFAALATLVPEGGQVVIQQERAHELGRFVGVRHEGRLVAMAGERMKAGAYTEVSGVCTHPDARGKGYAAGLMREIARGVVARGETPFLHAFADNAGAIALYEKLGYVVRWRPLLMVFQHATQPKPEV